MNRKILHAMLAGMMTVSLCACGSTDTAAPAESTPEAEQTPETTPTPEPVLTWEDLYEQGMEFFEDENYEEAITAFTESIDLDDQQAIVYIRRGDSYVRMEALSDADMDAHLTNALNDYEKAIELDDSLEDAYLGKADVLIRREQFEEAYDLLQSAQAAVSDSSQILAKTAEIETGEYIDTSRQIRRKDTFDTSGSLVAYIVYQYNFLGQKVSWDIYDGPGLALRQRVVSSFGENGLAERNDIYNADGSLNQYQTLEYDERGLETRRDNYKADGTLLGYYITYHDEEGKETGYDACYPDGSLAGYWRYDYDDNGNLIQENHYNPDGSLNSVSRPSDN